MNKKALLKFIVPITVSLLCVSIAQAKIYKDIAIVKGYGEDSVHANAEIEARRDAKHKAKAYCRENFKNGKLSQYSMDLVNQEFTRKDENWAITWTVWMEFEISCEN